MTSFDPRMADALGRELPLRGELEPAWSDVLRRAERRPPGRILASRWAVVAAVVCAAGLSVGGLAIADAVEQGPLHAATLGVREATLPGGISSCDLIGRPAAQVAATLAGNGIAIEWRFTHWGTTVVTTAGEPKPATPQEKAEETAGEPKPATPQEKAEETARAAALQASAAEAVTGGSSEAVSSPPAGSVVWDVVPDGEMGAYVFVQSSDDPNAPKIDCPG